MDMPAWLIEEIEKLRQEQRRDERRAQIELHIPEIPQHHKRENHESIEPEDSITISFIT